MDFFKTNDWSSPQKRAEFKDIVRKSKHVMKCGGDIKVCVIVRVYIMKYTNVMWHVCVQVYILQLILWQYFKYISVFN